MHKMWLGEPDEEEQVNKVQSFLSRLRWNCNEDAGGGITWIELYILYSIHGGSRDYDSWRQSNKLKAPHMLQKQVADFKKTVRKIKKYAVPNIRSGTWIRATSTATAWHRPPWPTGKQRSEECQWFPAKMRKPS